MKALVLLKAVPVVGTERLDERHRVDRSTLEGNGADEYCLEKALRLVEAAGGEVSVLTVGPGAASDALRKALAMGADRAYHVTDPDIGGSDVRGTLRVLEAAVRRIDFDLLFAGSDTSDGGGGVLGAALSVRLGLPHLSRAADVELAGESRVRVRRLIPSGVEVVEAAMPALIVGTQLLGEPRYPSLRGIMAARSKETATWTLAHVGLDATGVGAPAASTVVLRAEETAARGRGRVIRAEPAQAVQDLVEFLGQRGFC
jgi:electron transfer flavoprotein beta subunit